MRFIDLPLFLRFCVGFPVTTKTITFFHSTVCRGEAAGAALKDLYKDISTLGIMPFSQNLLDDYGWALDNLGAVFGGDDPLVSAS